MVLFFVFLEEALSLIKKKDTQVLIDRMIDVLDVLLKMCAVRSK